MIPRIQRAPPAAPERCVGVTLGLTLYLDEPLAWARQHAAEALEVFLAYAARSPGAPLGWFTTSMLPEWKAIDRGNYAPLVQGLSQWNLPRPRHQFRFRLADDPGVPELGFAYREVARPERTGVLELTLPQEHDPSELLALAIEVGQRWPVRSGVGGYQIRWSEAHQPEAFWCAYWWCQRYLGLDLQDADAMAWPAARALPGSNWLTLIGAGLARGAEWDLAQLSAQRFERDVRVQPLARATLVRAGDAPTVGDANAMEYPHAYAEAARALAPWFVDAPPEYWGGFWENKATRAWLRRLVEPEAWR